MNPPNSVVTLSFSSNSMIPFSGFVNVFESTNFSLKELSLDKIKLPNSKVKLFPVSVKMCGSLILSLKSISFPFIFIVLNKSQRLIKGSLPLYVGCTLFIK